MQSQSRTHENNNSNICFPLNKKRIDPNSKYLFSPNQTQIQSDGTHLQINHKNSHLPKRKVKTWTTEEDHKLM